MICLTRKSATSAREMNPERIDKHAIRACALPVGQDAWSNNSIWARGASKPMHNFFRKASGNNAEHEESDPESLKKNSFPDSSSQKRSNLDVALFPFFAFRT